MRTTLSLQSAAALATAACFMPPAAAQSPASDYPAKPVRVLVGLAPGGGTDIQARLIAQKLTENTKRSFIVENRTGAGGTVAYAAVAKSPPDGYTLLAVASGFSITPALYSKLTYDPIKDLAPISLVVQTPLVMMVHPSLPVRSVKELIATAKARPGMLDSCSAGQGTTPHMALELFNIVAGTKISHVPYKGTGQSMIDLMAGQVQMGFGNILASLPYVRSGKVKALAVTGKKRAAALPGVPTVAESGAPGYEVTTWHAWLAPAGTPDAIIAKVNSELALSLKSREVGERLTEDGGELVGSSPAELNQLLVTEIGRWRKVVKQAGIKIE
jgi:tripartite-type tricarboxylate transporter receptor subunit TctC